jgi:hypothetical protein
LEENTRPQLEHCKLRAIDLYRRFENTYGKKS